MKYVCRICEHRGGVSLELLVLYCAVLYCIVLKYIALQ